MRANIFLKCGIGIGVSIVSYAVRNERIPETDKKAKDSLIVQWKKFSSHIRYDIYEWTLKGEGAYRSISM